MAKDQTGSSSDSVSSERISLTNVVCLKCQANNTSALLDRSRKKVVLHVCIVLSHESPVYVLQYEFLIGRQQSRPLFLCIYKSIKIINELLEKVTRIKYRSCYYYWNYCFLLYLKDILIELSRNLIGLILYYLKRS